MTAPVASSVVQDANLLVGLQKAEFSRASNLRSWGLRTQTALAIVAAATAFPVTEQWATLLAIVAFLLTFAVAALAKRAREVRGHAERLRRATLFANGLGMVISQPEMRDLITGAVSREETGRALADPAYFVSGAAPGPQRLGEMLAESAFWTKTLARIASGESWRLCIGGVTLGFVAFGASLSVAPEASPLGLRLFCVLIVLLLSAEVFGAALSYGAASVEIAGLEKRLSAELYGGADIVRLLAIVADYNGVVEGMPPFSAGLYDRHAPELNRQYGMWKTGPQP